MQKYNDSLLGVPVPQELMDFAECTFSHYEMVEKIVDIASAPDGYISVCSCKYFKTSVTGGGN